MCTSNNDDKCILDIVFHTGKAFPFPCMFSLNISLKTWIASFSWPTWQRQIENIKDRSGQKASCWHKHSSGLWIPPWGTWGFPAGEAWRWWLRWGWEWSTAPQTVSSSGSLVFPEKNVPRFWESPARPDLQTETQTVTHCSFSPESFYV